MSSRNRFATQHRAEAAAFLARRLRELANEREKLLRAYYADAIDVEMLNASRPGSTPR